MPQKILPLALVGLALASLTIGCHSSPPVAEPSLQKPNLEERMAASRARTPNDPGFFATPHDAPREKPSDRFPNTELVAMPALELEELAFLSIQRRKLVFSDAASLRRFELHGKRIEAHRDALRIAGDTAQELARELIDGEDPWEVYAGGMVWLDAGAPAPGEDRRT